MPHLLLVTLVTDQSEKENGNKLGYKAEFFFTIKISCGYVEIYHSLVNTCSTLLYLRTAEQRHATEPLSPTDINSYIHVATVCSNMHKQTNNKKTSHNVNNMTAQRKHTQTHTDNATRNTVALLNNLIVSTFLNSNNQSSHYKGVF